MKTFTGVKKQSIGIIVQWFGSFPRSFPIWKRSAASNESIDFIFVTDQKVGPLAPNMRVIKTTLEREARRYSQILGRTVCFPTAYKACDARAFYGILYAEELSSYDFWGYCDIDLVFGNIRHYLTPQILASYDRFYEYGHLNIYRNSDDVNHWYELPGSAYTLEEVFERPVKTTFEEHFGINRICEVNGLRWYRDVDYADISPKYPDAMHAEHGIPNYGKQLWYWDQGHACRSFASGKNVCTEQFVYIHHQKRKMNTPTLDSMEGSAGFFIMPHGYVAKEAGIPSLEEIRGSSNQLSNWEEVRCNFSYYSRKALQFAQSDYNLKRLWARQLGLRFKGKFRR